MPLAAETVRTLLLHYLGVEFGPAEIERLRPLVERHLEQMRELMALDLGTEDPRAMHYLNEPRLRR
ncbi:MAG: hypothetical protein HY690_01885 [Chloroflexi bacterium]|nr:hypothetical protein [Chloroflexota bacterium]